MGSVGVGEGGGGNGKFSLTFRGIAPPMECELFPSSDNRLNVKGDLWCVETMLVNARLLLRRKLLYTWAQGYDNIPDLG